MRIVYVHGAFSSHISFSYLRQQLPKHDAVFIEYTPRDDIRGVVKKITQAAVCNDDVVYIGHSLGGVLSVAASQASPVQSVITLSSPFGGSPLAPIAALFMPNSIYSHIAPFNSFITSIHAEALSCPVHSFVTTSPGSPFITEDNDGVVTVASQKALNGAHYIEYSLNHFEILLSDEVAHKIATIIGDIS